MHHRTILALLTVLGATGCAGSLPLFGSNEPGATAAVNETCPGFAAFDTNGDGWIEVPEFERIGAALFAEWDDTEDGLLSYNEFNDCFERRPQDRFAALDDNEDRMIDPGEFLDRDLFAEWDRDGDRRLGEGEFRFGELAAR